MDFERYANSKLYAAFEVVYKLLFINLLWILFNVVGMAVFTFMPATITMAILINSSIYKREYTLLKSFWVIFKKEYLKSQKLFLLLVSMGMILVFDINFFYQGFVSNGTLLHSIGLWLSILMGIVFLFMIIHIIPVYIHFPNLKVTKIIKFSLLVAFTFLIQTIMILIIFTASVVFILYFPVFTSVIPLVLFSSLTFVTLLILKPKYSLLLKDNNPTLVKDYIK